MLQPFHFLVSVLFLVPAVLVAVPLHELAHVLAAYVQGDRSVRNRGFLRFDPMLFIEPWGLAAAFLAKVAWGQRLPVNESRLRGVPGRVAYALAGPLANLMLGLVAGLAFQALLRDGVVGSVISLSQPPLGYLSAVLYALAFMNLSMFAFNLLPIPGLDGWRILETLLKPSRPRFFFDAWMHRRAIWQALVVIAFASSILPGAANLVAVVLIPFYSPVAHLAFGVCVGYPGLDPCP